MARYIDAEKIVFWIRHVSKDGLEDDVRKIAFSDEIARMPAADVVPRAEAIDELKRYIRLNEDIALKCKRENGEQNEEYFKGKLAAFKQIRGFIDCELKEKYTEGEDDVF